MTFDIIINEAFEITIHGLAINILLELVLALRIKKGNRRNQRLHSCNFDVYKNTDLKARLLEVSESIFISGQRGQKHQVSDIPTYPNCVGHL